MRKASLLGRRKILCDKEEQPTFIMGALSSMGDPVPVRSTACLNELDAPFPDGWATPFPIGFACLCPSLHSRHSR